MLNITTIPVTQLAQNSRILSCSVTKDAVVIDPGGDSAKIIAALTAQQLKCQAVWLTHSHFDHCGGVADLLERLSVPLFAHPLEREMRQKLPQVAVMFGLPPLDFPVCPEPTDPIVGAETLTIGELKASTLFTPGHSPGHICFYFASEGICVSGDLVFQGSVGRTDLPGGDHEILLKSIREEILTLPDQTKLLPGHGPDTSVGIERESNPFFGRYA